MVRCGTCDNNCCNAGYGQEGKCPDCPAAYALQDKLWAWAESRSTGLASPPETKGNAEEAAKEICELLSFTDLTNVYAPEGYRAQVVAIIRKHIPSDEKAAETWRWWSGFDELDTGQRLRLLKFMDALKAESRAPAPSPLGYLKQVGKGTFADPWLVVRDDESVETIPQNKGENKQ